MARKRMIDPEFWSDEEIGHWPFAVRLFYIGLWNFADDEGRLKANSALLKSQIFPYDRGNIVKIECCKQKTASKIQWYEVNGSQYGFIKNFLKYQRIDKPSISKLPPPPKFDEHSAKPQRDISPKLKEVNISKDNISISSQIENLLKCFPSNIQTNIKTYWERARIKNKSKVITNSRRLTLLNELYNSFQRCNDNGLFNYALEEAISRDVIRIGYLDAIIRDKKTKKPI